MLSQFVPRKESSQVIFFIITGLVLFILGISIQMAMSHKKIYDHSLGKISSNYVLDDSLGIIEKKVPFVQLDEERFYAWDAAHYKNISKNNYTLTSAYGTAEYAFFPLFPWLWRLTHLDGIGISILNFLLFLSGIILLIQTFAPKDFKLKFLLLVIALVLPGTVVTQIPYTESLFVFTFALAAYFMVKGNYGFYFIFMLLFAMTRPAVIIMLLSIFFAEVYLWSLRGNLKSSILGFVKMATPLIIGTAVVSVVQYVYTGRFFEYLTTQKNWGRSLSIPVHFNDWSHEGFGMSTFLLFVVSLPVMIFLIVSFIRNIRQGNHAMKIESDSENTEGMKFELWIISLMYMVGITLFVLLYQHGSLNGLQRYLAVTPFFYIFLFELPSKLSNLKLHQRNYIFYFFAAAVVFKMTTGYHRSWNFRDMGFVLFTLILILMLYMDKMKPVYRYLLLLFVVGAGLIWKAYLMNVFLSKGWIFT